MEIEQQVSNVVPAEDDPLIISSPSIAQRRITSTVAIQSGQTVTLGGLITDRKTKSSAGIPVLSQIPILGALFGTRARDTARTELLVLITPRVVGNVEEARQVTDELKRRMRRVTPLGLRIR
jgi:general secretion pathway protein D